jgi:molybdopterin synthase catalytic subunit
MPLMHLTASPIDVGAVLGEVVRESERVHGGTGACGALASFVGMVRRDHAGRRVTRLEYEAYESLAVKVLTRIGQEVGEEWPGTVLAIHHRVGDLAPGEISVVIGAASAHRAEAFAACRYAIERIKQVAPIWKREHFGDGETWLEGATADPDDSVARLEARKQACG